METDRLDWLDIVPERFVAFRNPACSRDHLLELVRYLREHVVREPVTLIEECYELFESNEISLHDRGRVDWDRFEQALAADDFSRWQTLLSDSSMVLAGGSLELAVVLKERFGGEILEPAAFEWRFLSHYSQEVEYGGDRNSYRVRSEAKPHQRPGRPRWLEYLIAIALGLLVVWVFSLLL